MVKILFATLALLLASIVHAEDEFYVHGIVKLAFPDGKTSVNYEVSGPMDAKLCQATISQYEQVMEVRAHGAGISVLHVSATCTKRDSFDERVMDMPKRA